MDSGLAGANAVQALGLTGGWTCRSELVTRDRDGHADSRVGSSHAHDPPFALHTDCPTRGHAFQEQGQADLLSGSDRMIGLEENPCQAGVTGCTGPFIQFHGYGHPISRRLAPIRIFGIASWAHGQECKASGR